VVNDRLPDFVVIGAMKSGTTSLHGYLDDHPDVFVSHPKELDFFLDQGNWARGLDWYTDHFSAAPPEAVLGEVSPSYSQTHLYPEVPSRMAARLPNAKLVYVIREPVERIRSMYAHLVIDGLESAPIDEAVKANGDYVETSRYAARIGSFAPAFADGRMLVITTEQLRDKPVATLDAVAGFIGARPWSELDRPMPDARNITGDRRVEHAMGLRLKERPTYWGILNRSWRARRLHHFVFDRPVAPPSTTLSVDVDRWLRELLEPDTVALESLLDRRLIEWGRA
jgi:hypothetical protein